MNMHYTNFNVWKGRKIVNELINAERGVPRIVKSCGCEDFYIANTGLYFEKQVISARWWHADRVNVVSNMP